MGRRVLKTMGDWMVRFEVALRTAGHVGPINWLVAQRLFWLSPGREPAEAAQQYPNERACAPTHHPVSQPATTKELHHVS